MILVALYATLGLNSIQYIIDHAELKIIFCENKNIEKVSVELYIKKKFRFII